MKPIEEQILELKETAPGFHKLMIPFSDDDLISSQQ